MSAEYTRAFRGTSRSIARASFAMVASASLILFAACGDKKSDANLSTDTSLGRDLAMASTDTNAQPKLQDVPVTPPPPVATAPVAKAPVPKPKPAPKPATTTPTTSTAPATVPAVAAPAAKPAAPKTGNIEAGTSMSFVANSKVCSNTVSVGEKFTAQLSQAVSGTNGAVIPAGATGTFEVTESHTAKNSGDKAVLVVRLVAVTFDGNTYPVQATVETSATVSRSASKTTDAKKVAGGAAIGALIGQIIGKNTKGTVIGAGAGAAAGTAVAVATADYDACLNSGSAIAVKLDAPVAVRIGT